MDEIRQRRETRRRRILENSENRLNRISGVEQKTNYSPIAHIHNERFDDEPEYTQIPQNSNEQRIPETTDNNVSRQPRKVVIAALALFINFLLLMIDLLEIDKSAHHLNKVFIPLFCYEIFDFVGRQDHKIDSNGYIYLLVSANIRNPYLASVLRNAQVLTALMQDVMLYFFVFVCCELIKSAFM